MKNYLTILLFSALWLPASGFGQTSVRLLISEFNGSFGADTITPSSRDSSTYHYDTALRLSEVKTWYSYNSPALDLYSRVTNIVYDTAGNVLSKTYQKYVSGGWEYFSRDHFTYNAQGQTLSYTGEFWTNNAWQTGNSASWTYNANGDVLTFLGTNNQLTIYAYNAQGLLDSETVQVMVNGNWVNYTRKVFSYLPNTVVPADYITQVWNGALWANLHKNAFTYDTNGDKSGDLYQDWNGASWINNSKYTYQYDADHNLIYYVRSLWESGAWKDAYRELSTYDNASNKLTKRFETKTPAGWRLQTNARYHYLDVVGTHSPGFMAFEFYPNPAGSFITLKGAAFFGAKLYDLQGRLLRFERFEGQTEASFQLGNLPAGTYLLQAIGEDGKTGLRQLQIKG